MIIICRLVEGWETEALYRPWVDFEGFQPRDDQSYPSKKESHPYGSYLLVRWDLTELARKEDEAMMAEEEAAAPEDRWGDLEPRPEIEIHRHRIRKLGDSLAKLREDMIRFRCYVEKGGPEEEKSRGPQSSAAAIPR